MYRQAKAVTPSDTVDIGFRTDALWIGTGAAGSSVNIIMEDGNTVAFKVVANTELRVNCTRVMATGTTATDIVALKH